jgi:polysaccharide biosynthesis transport protein
MLDQPLHQIGQVTTDRPSESRHLRARQGRRASIVWQLVTVSTIALLASAALYPLLPRTYTASASVLLRPTNQEGATTWDQSVRDALDDNAIQTKIDIFRSEGLQLSVIQAHNLLADPEFNRSLHPSWLRRQAAQYPWLEQFLPGKRSDSLQVEYRLGRNLVVKRERKSYLIQVGYESDDPDKAAALTNTLVNGFLADQINRKLVSHQALLMALAERIRGLQTGYHTDEQVEHDFVVSSGLSHRGENESIRKQLETLSTAVAEAMRHTAEATTRADMLVASQRTGGLESTKEALSSLLLQQLRQRFVELSAGAAGSGVPVGATGGVVSFLRQGIEAEAQHLVKAAQNDASVAQQTEAILRGEVGRLDARLVEVEENERKRADLHRAVQTDLDAINAANQRYMQEAGRGDVLQPDVEIVSLASPPDRPSFPIPLFYGAGTMAIVTLLCGIILLPTMMRATSRVR